MHHEIDSNLKTESFFDVKTYKLISRKTGIPVPKVDSITRPPPPPPKEDKS